MSTQPFSKNLDFETVLIYDDKQNIKSHFQIISLSRTPHNTQCLYFIVVAGDSRQEAYRLSTFYRFPNNHVDSRSLARNGFYFTGYKDCIKCFRWVIDQL